MPVATVGWLPLWKCVLNVKGLMVNLDVFWTPLFPGFLGAAWPHRSTPATAGWLTDLANDFYMVHSSHCTKATLKLQAIML